MQLSEVSQVIVVDDQRAVASGGFRPAPLDVADVAINKGKVASFVMPVRWSVIPVGGYVDVIEIEDAIVDGPLGRVEQNKHVLRIRNLRGFMFDS